jgi:hypothetical protein
MLSGAGMESGNSEADGQMDLPTSHSARFRQARSMCTTSPLLGKEGLCFGMPTSHGLEQLSMDQLSYFQNDMRPTHSPNPSKKFPSFLVRNSRLITY